MLANYFGSVRFVYNHFLAKRKEQYEQTRKSSNYYEQAKELTAMKKTEAFSWLKEINSQTLQHALRHLETAYVNFFKGRTRFPRFHSKKHGGSFAVPQHFKVEGNRIFIPKFKGGYQFFNDTATTEIYTLSLHDALPISESITFASWRRLRSETWRKPI